MPSTRATIRLSPGDEPADSLLARLYRAYHDEAAPGAVQAASQLARRDLDRYYRLLEASMPALRSAEASLLCDATNGTLWEPTSIRLLWAEIDDAVRSDGLAEKWKVDGPALVARLRALPGCGSAALVDSCERYWVGTSDPALADASQRARLEAAGFRLTGDA